MTNNGMSSVSPVSSVMGARGVGLRSVACVLAILAMVLPGITGSAFGVSASTRLLDTWGWMVLLPLLLVMSTALPAFAPRYQPLLDFGAAVIAAIASVVVVVSMNDAQSTIDGINGLGALPGRPVPQVVSGGLGIGSWLLFADTALTAVLAVLQLRNR